MSIYKHIRTIIWMYIYIYNVQLLCMWEIFQSVVPADAAQSNI